jgi:hypothetical protein
LVTQREHPTEGVKLWTLRVARSVERLTDVAAPLPPVHWPLTSKGGLAACFFPEARTTAPQGVIAPRGVSGNRSARRGLEDPCSHGRVKLATWNSCAKSATNIPLLLGEGVDVAVVCEASPISEWSATADGRQVSGFSHRVWAESPRELAVLACQPWSVTRHERSESAPAWMLPVRVAGPIPFVLVGVWTLEYRGTPDYVRQLDAAVDWIEQFGGVDPVVLAGDLNAPISTSQAAYDKVARRLEGLGLVDAYRVSRGLAADDAPAEATYYHYRRRGLPFHIDHVMVPAAWVDSITVEVGDFDTWVGSGRSDHVPVIVDIDIDIDVDVDVVG